MDKYDPKLKKHIRKRKMYNIGPLITVDNLDKIETGFDVFANTMNIKSDKWLSFAQNHMTKFNPLPFPFHEQLPFLYLISNANIQSQLIKTLLRIKDYDPNIDPLPLEKLPINLSKYLEKKQLILQRINDLIKENLFVEKNVVGIYFPEQFDEKILGVLNFLKFDIIIFAEKNLRITINQFPPKFYEIKGKAININEILKILTDFCGKPQIEKNFYILQNNITKKDLINIIKDNIS